MTSIVVLLPVLARPHRVKPMLESVQGSRRRYPLSVLFIVSPEDHDEISEIKASGAEYIITNWPSGNGDYARKINLGVRKTDSEWILAGADDIHFQRGWAEAAVSVGSKTKKRFVATNDLANPLVIRGDHATHPLVHRSYIEEYGTIDEPGKLYCEKYTHQCIDNEATATAKFRNEFVFAKHSIVEHHHPVFPRRGVKVAMDDTYRKGMMYGREDIRLLRSREHLWSH